MNNTAELRERCAQRLTAAAGHARELTAFVGLDGFVDEIVHVVDKRDSAGDFSRLPTIAALAKRLAAAAGRSTNVELVTTLTKLGGNGPIMGNALASLGLRVTYLGTLGYPNMHPVFVPFSQRAEVYTIAEAAHTDALEFDDGKIMFGKLEPLKEVTWDNIQKRFGRDKFEKKFRSADLVAFVNWTMLPYMSDLWDSLLKELCPAVSGTRRKMFFDLADPEKRNKADIQRALGLIARFQKFFDVILGLNEKEAVEVGEVLGLKSSDHTPDGLCRLAADINRGVAVETVVVHPVAYALAAGNGKVSLVEGPYVARPLITTGAGDHFNSGFCLGKMLGFENDLCVLTGVTTSGHYVRTGQSPSIDDLAAMLRHWPATA
jgi:sugar/nucleoside kinase (ribokinase family)